MHGKTFVTFINLLVAVVIAFLARQATGAAPKIGERKSERVERREKVEVRKPEAHPPSPLPMPTLPPAVREKIVEPKKELGREDLERSRQRIIAHAAHEALVESLKNVPKLQRSERWTSERLEAMDADLKVFGSHPRVLDAYPSPEDASAQRLIVRLTGKLHVLDYNPTNKTTVEKAESVINADIDKRLRQLQTTTVRPFTIEPTPSGVTIRTASRTIALQSSELQKLKSGQPLPAEHAFSNFVRESSLDTERCAVLVDTHLTRRHDELDTPNVEALLSSISYAYKTFRVIADVGNTAERGQAAIEFDRAKHHQLEFVTPQAGVTDFNLTANFDEEFRAHGFAPANFSEARKIATSEAARAGSVILLFTGHSDAGFEQVIENIPEKALRGRVVLLQTCQTELTRKLKHLLITKGARSVHSYVGKIEPGAVGEFLNDVIPKLAKPPPGEDVRTIIRDSAKAAGLNMYDSMIVTARDAEAA